MSKSSYSYIRDAYKTPKETYVHRLQWERKQKWRKEGAVVRVRRPTRLDRARSLGYKAKEGIIVVRTRVRKGGRRKSRFFRGRRTKHMGMHKINPKKSLQWIGEERAAKRYPNMEVLNSYWVDEDGKHKWYEVILINRSHPAILRDPFYSWVSNSRGRVFRGKTSAGHKGRGLRTRGIGAEKVRPSIRRHSGKGK